MSYEYVFPMIWNITNLTKFVEIIPVGKIAEKPICRSVFLTIWHCILSA